jgi:hypothetical protein
MKIAFHTNQLSLRGTEVSMYDYAKYNEELLGNESIIVTRHPDVWKYSDPQAIEKFKARFPVFFYHEPKEIEGILEANKVDVFYAQKSGHNDGIISKNRKTVVHAVFQDYEPHGDRYAFISQWLSDLYGSQHDFVPYMVDLPNVDENLRHELGIPENAIVYGRHGGLETFDIPFVQNAVVDVAVRNRNIYFVFMNTERFSNPGIPNIIYLEPTADLVKKTKFINTCDAMLHARRKGESFGLAIAEFSIRNKPVITWTNAVDSAHHQMLGRFGIYYNNYDDLIRILSEAKFKEEKKNWNRYSQFSPQAVMDKFKKVFLD